MSLILTRCRTQKQIFFLEHEKTHKKANKKTIDMLCGIPNLFFDVFLNNEQVYVLVYFILMLFFF